MALLLKWYKELNRIGVKDWLWWVVYLKRDEFSPKLDLNKYYPDLDRLVRDRNRAHNIELALDESWDFL